jgi:hypothetical protein
LPTQNLPYDSVPAALLAIDLLARQLRPKLEGEVCVGAVTEDMQVAWWCARLGPQLSTSFVTERPGTQSASLLLGTNEAEALVQGGTLGSASLVLTEGDNALMARFFEALAPKEQR